MMQYAEIGDDVYFWFAANTTAGAAGDGATPLYDVRLAGEAANAAPTASGTPTLLTHADYPDGIHEIVVDTDAYSAGTYAVFCTLTISEVNPAGFVGAFKLRTAGDAAFNVNATHWLGTAIHAATVNGIPVVQLHNSAGTGGINAPANFEDLTISDTTGFVSLATTQKVDVETIKTQTVTCANPVTVLASVGTAATSTAQTGDSYAIVNGDHGLVSIQDDIDAILADTNELQGDWVDGGRLDLLLDGAASAGDPWTTTLPGAYGAGTAGKIVGDYVNSSLSAIKTVVDTIQADTDLLDDVSGGLADIHTDIGTLQTGLDKVPKSDGSLTFNATCNGSIKSGLSTQAELDKVPKSDGSISWNATALAAILLQITTALNTAIPGSPTADSINERIKALDDLVTAAYGSTEKANVNHITADYGATEKAAIDLLDDADGGIADVHTTANSILADTNELQTDLTDGGRLDLLIDAIKTAAEAIDTLTKAAGSGDLARALVILEKVYKSAATIVEGEAAAGTLSTTEMTTDLTEATNDHYNGRILIWTSGVLQNQATDITDYDGATKKLTFTAVTEAPTAADTFVIV